MKKIVRLTESDLTRIVKRIINERQYLMEGEGDGFTQSNTPTIYIYLPYTLNPKDQSKKYNPLGRANFTIVGTKTPGPGGGFNTDEYKKIIQKVN